MDFYRVQADDGLGGAFGDVAVVAGTYTTIEHLESKGWVVVMLQCRSAQEGRVDAFVWLRMRGTSRLGGPTVSALLLKRWSARVPTPPSSSRSGKTSCGDSPLRRLPCIFRAAGGGSGAFKSPDAHCRTPGKTSPASLDSAGLPGVSEVETIPGYMDDALALAVKNPQTLKH